MLWSDSATAGAANGPVGVTFEGAWALDNAAGSAPNKLRSVVGDGDSITSAFVVAELEEVYVTGRRFVCFFCSAGVLRVQAASKWASSVRTLQRCRREVRGMGHCEWQSHLNGLLPQ